MPLNPVASAFDPNAPVFVAGGGTEGGADPEQPSGAGWMGSARGWASIAAKGAQGAWSGAQDAWRWAGGSTPVSPDEQPEIDDAAAAVQAPAGDDGSAPAAVAGPVVGGADFVEDGVPASQRKSGLPAVPGMDEVEDGDGKKKKKKKKKKAKKSQPGDGWSTDSDDERPLAAMGGGLPKVTLVIPPSSPDRSWLQPPSPLEPHASREKSTPSPNDASSPSEQQSRTPPPRANAAHWPEDAVQSASSPGKQQGPSAQLLRWNSTVSMAGMGVWSQLPSVTTWFTHRDSKYKGLALQMPGQRVLEPSLEDFEVLRLVGQGGFGKVYQVRKRATGRIMALKAMRKHMVIDELNVEGTKTERQVLESVDHPYIIRLWSAFHDHGRLYLLMDWHNGGQLFRLIQEHAPFGEANTRFYLAEIVMAIDGLHERGIVHRDLKPENVLINSRGHLVITDFGASKMKLEDEVDIRTNSWVGTELFMAPETLQGKVYGRVVDWWAVGVLAWEMFTGDNPFYHENPEQIAIKVQKKKLLMPTFLGPSTHSLIKGLLTRDPEKRLGKGGAKEVREHAFFSKCKGFSWKSAWNKEVKPPYFDPDLEIDPLNVSRMNELHLSKTPVMSPVLQAHKLSPGANDVFKGFEWVSPAYSPGPGMMPWRDNAARSPGPMMPSLSLLDEAGEGK